MRDLIDLQEALDEIREVYEYEFPTASGAFDEFVTIILPNLLKNLSTIKMNDKIHLCEFCMYDYPECPAKNDDVIFGNGIGHDNICACAKFEIKPERTAKVKSKNYYGTTTNTVGYFTCIGKCGNCDCEVNEHYIYCPVCGARLEWK